MKHKDLFNLLKSVNIPVAYDHFEDNKNLVPPFMAYRDLPADFFKADNKNYFLERHFEIELVTSKKDFELEELIDGENGCRIRKGVPEKCSSCCSIYDNQIMDLIRAQLSILNDLNDVEFMLTY